MAGTAAGQQCPPAGPADPDFSVRIDMRRDGDLLRVEAFGCSLRDAGVEYRLTAEKKGKAGTSQTAQSGKTA
jgi:hypothetical protein